MTTIVQVVGGGGAPLRGMAGRYDEKEGSTMPSPQIKDEERYQALRRDGASKEKAARIANTDATKAGKRGGSSKAYEEWSKSDLYDRAKEIGIEGRSHMTKDELIDALRNH